MKIQIKIIPLAAALSLFVALGCNKADSTASPVFAVLDTTIIDGDTWLLNRPVDIFFDDAVDFSSVSTSSVIFRATDSANLGIPVTGTYELISDVLGRANHGIRFTPACPTNTEFDNGGFVPGNIGYELLLPTESSGGFTVVRSTSGHALSIGLTRRFVTPSLGDTYFYDSRFTPAQMTLFEAPSDLGLLSVGVASFTVEFDQGINPSPTNFSSDKLYIEYADANGTFPATPNKIPGEWLVANNCGDSAELVFQVSGVLLPGRSVRAVTTSEFQDLSGDQNNNNDISPTLSLATLSDIYNDITIDDDDVAYDQFIEDFAVGTGLDLDADLAQPLVLVNQGNVTANFVFPDDNGSTKVDFHLVNSHFPFNTNGIQVDTDDAGNTFTLVDGVMYTNDFTIEAGASIRAFGDNPLIIYVAGDALIEGEIDASGYDANPADGLSNRHDIVVAGGLGSCGGGNGGDASSETAVTSPVGDSGNGPFGTSVGGGSGGEGGYQQEMNPAAVGGGNTPIAPQFLVAGGGGGGAFALTRTDAVFWDAWPASSLPYTYDNSGPDLRSERHTIFDGGAIDPDAYFTGAENGMRGSSFGSSLSDAFPTPQAVRGYLDDSQDMAADDAAAFDPAQTGGSLDDDSLYGVAVDGPDGGSAGISPFLSTDPTFGTSNDFYGTRYFWDGTVGSDPVNVHGELLAAHAGSGGGGSGDIQTVIRYIDDGTGNPLPISSHYPDLSFPHGTTQRYMRGAGGGGGGGQIQIHVIGHIILAPTTLLKVNGGNGAGGDSAEHGGLSGSTTQVSGSGGGSGGHLIMSSASGLNLSSVDVGVSGTPGNASTFFDNTIPNYLIQAVGGRRGWSMSSLANNFLPADNAPNDYDGNGSFQTGRGGAGGSGVIQIHLPNPLTDIAYHSNVASDFKDYITHEDLANPIDSDRQDQVLGLYAMPTPFTLMPFYSPQSQVQSVWVDTGLAGLRQPPNGVGPFPDYDFGQLDFDGLDALGYVLGDGEFVDVLPDIGSGIAGDVAVDASGFSVAISNNTLSSAFVHNPKLLVGCDFAMGASTHEIIDAGISANGDLILATLVADGALGAAAPYAIRNKYFGVSSSGIKDKLPMSSSLRIQFQGADGVSQESITPDTASFTEWTGIDGTTLDDLDGKRFLRYRLTFDIDALNQGGFNDLSRPSLSYLKVPFAW